MAFFPILWLNSPCPFLDVTEMLIRQWNHLWLCPIPQVEVFSPYSEPCNPGPLSPHAVATAGKQGHLWSTFAFSTSLPSGPVARWCSINISKNELNWRYNKSHCAAYVGNNWLLTYYKFYRKVSWEVVSIEVLEQSFNTKSTDRKIHLFFHLTSLRLVS